MPNSLMQQIKIKLNKKDVASPAVVWGILLMSLAFVFDAFGVNGVASWLRYITYGIIVLSFILISLKIFLNKARPDILYVLAALVIAMIFLSLTASLAVNDLSGFSLVYYKSFVRFALVLVMLYIAYEATLSEGQIYLILADCVLTGVIMAVLGFALGDDGHKYGSETVNNLTLGLSSPNIAAIFLFMLFQYIMLAIAVFKSKGLRIALTALEVLLFIHIYRTISLDTLIVMLVYSLGLIWIMLKKCEPFKNAAYALVLLAPMLLALLYMFIPYDVNSLFGIKAELWVEGIKSIKTNILFGSYGDYASGQGAYFNFCNTLIYILAYFGAVPFVISMMYIFGIIRDINMYEHKAAKLLLWSFAAALLTGIGDSSLMAGIDGLFVFAAGFLAIAQSSSHLRLWNEAEPDAQMQRLSRRRTV